VPFKPSSWSPRTTVPVLGGTSLTIGHMADDGVLLVASAAQFVDGPGVNDSYEINVGAVSKDRALTWTLLEGDLEMFASYFSVETPIGVRYFRLRKKFGRSFFIANSEMFAGYLTLDRSDNGLDWSPVQTFYSWPHLASVGAGRASNTYGMNYLRLPASGPGGADADWLRIRLNVTSDSGTPVDVTDWWRSDDFGETWVLDRAEAGPMVGTTLQYMEKSPNGGGRLIASTGASLFFSSNNGVTWTGAGGFLPANNKVQAVPQVGRTWCLIMSAGLGSQVQSGISCDDGQTWSAGGTAGAAQNANPVLIRLGPSEVLCFERDSDTLPTGVQIFYSLDGGETWISEGIDTRIPGLQASVTVAGLFPDGMPFVIGFNRVVLVSEDRPTGNFNQRSICPLANVGLKKAGSPNLCGHPMLQNPCF